MLRRVGTVLLQLELLSEAKGAGGFDAGVSLHKRPGDTSPPTQGSGTDPELDRQVESLERWCERAERAVRRARKRPPGSAETPEQFRERLCRDYQGVNYRTVAQRERISDSYVRRIREDAGFRPLDGAPQRTSTTIT